MNDKTPFELKRRARSPYWQVHFKDEHGRVERRSSKQADYDAAVAWAWEQINGPDPSNRPIPSLREFSEDFFIVGKCPIIKRLRSKGKQFGNRNATDRRGQLKNHIWKRFGQRKIDSLTGAEIEDWLIDHPGGNQLKNQILTTISYVLKEAKRAKFITELPTADIERFANDSDRRPAFQQDECDKLFAGPIETWESRWGNEMIAIAAFTAANTGMRLGEIRALQWHQVNFEKGLIYVEQNADNADNSIKKPKNGEARPAPLNDRLRYALLYLRNQQGRMNDAFIFSETGMSPFYTNVFYKPLKRALAAIQLDTGVASYGYHSFRRFYITSLRTAGIDNKTIQLIVGHKDEKTTTLYVRQTLDERAKLFNGKTRRIAEAISPNEYEQEVAG